MVGIMVIGSYVMFGKLKLMGPSPIVYYVPLIIVGLLICTVVMNLLFLIL
jgi:hypothetical protein